ncbi:MAG: general secretion pathway protein GspB [Bermanella sp.]
MSYLLKALKKAEQEREQQVQGEVVAKPISVASSSLPSGVVWLCVAVLLVTLVKVFMPMEHEEIESLGQAKEMDVLLAAPLPASVIPKNKLTHDFENSPTDLIVLPKAKVERQIEELVVETPDPKKNVESIAVKPEAPMELSELSKEILSQIPSIALESHIYSSAAQFRSVVINGRTFNEGMMINSSVVLNSITNRGVVLEVAGRKVALDKGITWVASKNAE